MDYKNNLVSDYSLSSPGSPCWLGLSGWAVLTQRSQRMVLSDGELRSSRVNSESLLEKAVRLPNNMERLRSLKWKDFLDLQAQASLYPFRWGNIYLYQPWLWVMLERMRGLQSLRFHLECEHRFYDFWEAGMEDIFPYMSSSAPIQIVPVFSAFNQEDKNSHTSGLLSRRSDLSYRHFRRVG